MAAAPLSFSPLVVLAVLAAALLHAAWNALAHNATDQLVVFALMGVVQVLGGGLLVLLTEPLPAAAWPYVLASVATHIVYVLFLLLSFQLGEFSQAYPLARGTAPLAVALVSLVWLGLELHPLQLAGVLTISAGLAGVVFAGGLPRREQLPAVAAAVATGLLIATYTVVDGLGVGAGPVLAYTGWLFLLMGPAMPVVAALRRGRGLLPLARTHAAQGLGGGVIGLLAYGIVLWAQTSGALAPVAALRETSVVFGALIGSAFLGERLGHRRAAAAAAVVAGVVLISLA
ncbi:DMT family transporter [Actinomycetes bacterium KLBMP 9759]